MRIVPLAPGAWRSQYLRAASRVCGAPNCVPRNDPRASRPRLAASLPLNRTVTIPALAAFCAASSFVRMPPVPCALPASPAIASTSAVIALDRFDRARAADRADGCALNKPSTSLAISSRSGVDQRRDGRGEVVVVAELQFLDRDRIVFVDDRHAAQPQQLRAACCAH